jgi:hypothetical protein
MAVRGGLAILSVLFGMVWSSALSAGVPSMSSSERDRNDHCQIIGSDKLPASSAGFNTICEEVERAIAAKAPDVRYSAEIKIISASRLAAALIVNGQNLPVQNFAVMDGNLSIASIKRFATALAVTVLKASKS